MPEFHVIFARKCPNVFMTFARKKIFPKIWGGEGALRNGASPPHTSSATPMDTVHAVLWSPCCLFDACKLLPYVLN